MTYRRSSALAALLVLALSACGRGDEAPATAPAADPAPADAASASATASGVEARDAWIRALPAGATVAGGYLDLVNATGRHDTLVAVESAAAARVEVHEMSMDGGIMRMRRLDGGVPLPAGGTVALAPGGLHLMFIAPVTALQPGERVPATLRFAHAPALEVVFEVRGVDGTPVADPHAGHRDAGAPASDAEGDAHPDHADGQGAHAH